MMKAPRTSLIALAAASFLPGVWTEVALAQAGGLGEIVVTARKREENMQDVPIAVTALSAETLKNQSVQSVKDIQYQTPSLTIAPTNADRNSLSVTIRGQNLSDTLLTLDPAIGIYIDGVNFAKTIGTELATLVDVDRVEVLKGPQGTLFGRNTTGGALSITTKLPAAVFEGQIIGRTDLYGRAGGSAVVNLPISGDQLALRVVGSYDRRDAFGRNLVDNREIGGDLNGGGLRATLLARPTDTIEVVLRADYNKTSTSASGWKARYLGPAGVPTTAGVIIAEGGASTLAGAYAAYIAQGQTPDFWDVRNNTSPSHSRVESYGGSGTITIDLSDSLQLKSITSYRSLKRDTLMDMDGSIFRILEVNGLTAQKLFAQEGQITGGLFDDSVDWIVGGFYSRETGNDGTRTLAVSVFNPLRSINDGDVLNKSVAGYGQFTWRFAEQFSFTGGLRYTKDTKSLISRNRSVSPTGVVNCNIPSPVSPTNCSQMFKDSWGDMSYTATVDYKPTEGVLIYAKTSRGFRSGGFNLRGTRDPQTFVSFAPETVTDYEVGLKADLLDRHLRVNIATYHSSYKDIQRTLIVPSPFPPFTSTVVRNAATAGINGVEAEITAKPTDALTLRATGALTDAKYKNYVDPRTGADLSNLKFNTVPKWTYTLSAGYDVPLDNGPLHLQLDWAWQDDIYWFPDSLYNGTNGTPDLRGQKAYGLLNGRISKSFENEGVEVAFYVRNALNKKYFANGLDVSSSLGFNSGLVGDPRVVGAEASIKF